MAEFLPFRGLRYNSDKVSLAAVLAPPYDVIKGEMRAQLEARNGYNVVGIELPSGEGDAKYKNAAHLLQEWRAQGIFVRDDAAFYIYEQEFAVPGATHEIRQRRGILGALTLEEFGQGVQPHEHTLSGPKEDRLKLLRATHTNTSPIFGLFDDSDGWVDGLLTAICSIRPTAEAQDAEGITHRLWRVTDDESVNALEAALEDESILIADGHHRYETALNYRNEQRAAKAAAGQEWTGAEGANGVLMMCVSMSDSGLIVLPTHRIIKGLQDSDLTSLLEKLETRFVIEPLTAEGARPTQAAELVRRVGEPTDLPRLGMYLNYADSNGASYLLTLREGRAHLADMDDKRSPAYNALDVTILHTLILDNELGIDAAALAAGGRVAYTIDAAEAIKPAPGTATVAFILRSTPVQQVQEVAAAGDKMPQKSTYFYPKLVTGLVLRPLR